MLHFRARSKSNHLVLATFASACISLAGCTSLPADGAVARASDPLHHTGSVKTADSDSARLAIWFAQPPGQLFEEAAPHDPALGENIPSGKLSSPNWEQEGLPVGNGRVGAMMFGGVGKERIQINEETIWAGPDETYRVMKPNPAEGLKKARELTFAGDYEAAEEVLSKEVLGVRGGSRSYQTLGDILIDFPKLDQGVVTSYRRELDLENAIASTHFDHDGVTYRREIFASAPDDALIVRLDASAPNSLDFSFALDRRYSAITVDGNCYIMTGQAQHKGDNLGTKYRASLCVNQNGGEVSHADGKLHVSAADSATMVLAVQTDYNRADPFDPLDLDAADLTGPVQAKVASRSYADLRARHISDYRRYYDRLTVDFGGTDWSDEPTDEMLRTFGAGEENPRLMEMFLQFGRYLLISSSRPGTMPANLQGIWGDAYAMPWNGDYHININMQMNYWLAESANLSELHQPYFDFFDRLSVAGEDTAKKLGMNGTVHGHASDAYMLTTIFGAPQWGMWVMGGPWATSHTWEHYLYTGDRQFLRDHALPQHRRYVAFALDWLVEDPGTGLLVSGPTTSPENEFYYDDPGTGERKIGHVTMGPTMDQQILFQLFTNYLAIVDALGIENDPLAARSAAALSKLAPTQIGPDGRIMEWTSNFQEVDPGHRHISQVYGVYPDSQFTYRNNRDLLEASRKTIEARLDAGGAGTGWSRAWIINLFARLKDAPAVRHHFSELLRKSTAKNLFDIHPPFQIDGNFGGAAGLLEALVQSHDGGIEFLPAWPAEWMRSAGSISGIRARGGFEVALDWNDGALTSAKLTSERGGTASIILNDHLPNAIVRNATTNGVVPADTHDGLLTFEAEAGATYLVQPQSQEDVDHAD